jgi:acetyltransferase-like isoleucine patch superfamily enzyme
MKATANFLSKISFRILTFQGKFRTVFYKVLGMSIGTGSVLGKLNVEWPGGIEIGERCEIQSNTTFWIKSPFKKENRIVIGNNVFIGRNTEFNCSDFILIGNNCLIASFTVLVDSSHTFYKDDLITKQATIAKGIIVEEDVWIGTGSKILLGVILGKGCIIGAGAVVNKSIPPYEIWAGIPARKIGERKSK